MQKHSPFFKPTEANTALFLDLMLALKTRIPLSMALQNKGLHSKSILWDQYEAKQLIWLDLDLFRNLGFIQPCLKLDRGILFFQVKTACDPKPVLVVKLFLGANMMQSSLCCANKPALTFPHNWWRCTFVLSEHVLRHNNKNMLLSRSCVSTNLLVQIPSSFD